MTNDELMAMLAQARMELMMLEAQLLSLREGPYTTGIIVNQTTAGRLRLASMGGVVEADVPIWEDESEKIAKAAEEGKWDKKKLKSEVKKIQKKLLKNFPDNTRVLLAKSGSIIEYAEKFSLGGTTVIVKRILADGLVETETASGSGSMTGSKLLYPLPESLPLAAGDQALLDMTGHCIIRNLGKPVTSTPFKLEHDFNVTWEDIGGLDHVRTFFEEVFVTPLQHADLYEKYGYRAPVGALLSGPPGNGKTMIAKALASQIAAARGLKTSGFFPVKGPEILSQWVGMAETRIRELFESARSFILANNAPAIIFVDEAEAAMNKRGSGKSSDVDRTIVPAWLTEMDGLNIVTQHPIFVLIATNRPELLDPAITREGRIDRKIHIPRPSAEAAKHIFEVHLRKCPLCDNVTRSELATIAVEAMFGSSHIICNIHRSESIVPVTLGEIASGAMIAATVQSASQIALRRDVAGKTFTGVSPDDLKEAVRDIFTQNSRILHEDAVKDICEPYKDDVVEVRYVK